MNIIVIYHISPILNNKNVELENILESSTKALKDKQVITLCFEDKLVMQLRHEANA